MGGVKERYYERKKMSTGVFVEKEKISNDG